MPVSPAGAASAACGEPRRCRAEGGSVVAYPAPNFIAVPPPPFPHPPPPPHPGHATEWSSFMHRHQHGLRTHRPPPTPPPRRDVARPLPHRRDPTEAPTHLACGAQRHV